VVGAVVILFDPIFQGLAIALMFGALASTALTLIVVPVLHYLSESRYEQEPLPAEWQNAGASRAKDPALIQQHNQESLT